MDFASRGQRRLKTVIGHESSNLVTLKLPGRELTRAKYYARHTTALLQLRSNQMNKQQNSIDWLEAELADTIDEDFKLELSEPALTEAIGS